jgi:hypothetical protein
MKLKTHLRHSVKASKKDATRRKKKKKKENSQLVNRQFPDLLSLWKTDALVVRTSSVMTVSTRWTQS